MSSESWNQCLSMYSWTVDLSTFQDAALFPNHFDYIVSPDNIANFEIRFRDSVENASGNNSYLAVAEVVYWKSYGNYQSRNRLTKRLIEHMQIATNWFKFCDCVKRFVAKPGPLLFELLQKVSSQPRGFAVPLTFVSFYDPEHYPMVDKHIANWWNNNKGNFGFNELGIFLQRDDGWIETTSSKKVEQNLAAYFAWADFCRKQAAVLSKVTRSHWRARDVEIAVWESQKRGIPLPTLE